MKSKNHPSSLNIIRYLSLITFTLLISKASFAMTPEVTIINGDVGSYLGFNLETETNHTCATGAPTWGKVSGLPAGMNRGRCSIYGRPEAVGTFRLEFPTAGGGVWLADLVVAGDNTTTTPTPEPTTHIITGNVGQYLAFNLLEGTNATCATGAPTWGRVLGLPAGMNRGRCAIYGYPETAGTSRLEFPIAGGVWLADLVIVDENTPIPEPTHTITGTTGQYLTFSLSEGTNAACATGGTVSGLPAGMNQDSCTIYGSPETVGTFHLEFPIAGGVWLADLVVTRSNSNSTPTIAEISAARFLAQSTFGATSNEITALAAGGNQFGQWIDAQFELPVTSRLSALRSLAARGCSNSEISSDEMASVWWDAALNGDDQLRQRVAFALSEILVISKQGDLNKQAIGLTDYYDVLTRNAFGNYRDLLREVTLHPTMGIYLTMFANRPANGDVRPDENYARELLQLFAIGMNQLNLDGTIQQDPITRNPIPTYSQSTVENFAKVFTGWNLTGIRSYNSNLASILTNADMTLPMTATATYHDTTEKTLLNNTVLPAGQSTEEDLDFAITNVFEHPNVGPFIGKQLIQRLVTSNPSDNYVRRVAQAFNDNGAGERGDLRAVVRAILLDPEARNVHPASDNFGKLREPLLRLSHLRRTFGAVPVTVNEGCGNFDLYRLSWASLGSTSSIQTGIGQNILHSPSVFNFFLPNYSPPGIVTESSLVAPEFQIVTENTMVNLANVIGDEIQNSGNSNNISTAIITNREVELANDSNALLNHLNLLLLSGSMSSDLRTHLLSLLENSVYPDSELGRSNKVKDVMTLIASSPDYLIQQ